VRKQVFLFLFLLVLCGKGVFALLEINSTSEVHLIENTQSNFSLSLWNNFNFTIYNVTFESSNANLHFPTILNMTANQTVNTYFWAQTVGEWEADSVTLVRFDYYTTQMAEPKTETIQINENYINPPNINLLRGDTLHFVNENEAKNYTIRERYNAWTFELPKSASYNMVFSAVGNQEFINVQTGYVGNVSVWSNMLDSFTHNSAYDRSINIHISSKYNASVLTANFLTTSFSMNYTEVRNGAVFLEAPNLPIYNVVLTADPDWLTFDKKNFNIQDNTVVTYQLKPRIRNSTETGMNYTINVTVASSNGNNVTGLINVYIQNESSVDATYADLPAQMYFVTDAQLATFCKKNPTLCPHQNITQIVERNITTNDTVEIRELRSYVERVYNKFSQLETGIIDAQTKIEANKHAIEEQSSKIASIYDMMIEDRKETKFWIYFAWIVGILASLSVAGFFGVKWLKKYLQRRHVA
jgi:hypothetical protein